MHAVIRTGGKQYYVTAGDILEVEKLEGNVGDTITLTDVLMIAGDSEVTVGQPIVEGASVNAKITGQHRGEKIQVFRYRPKKRIRVRKGHRQYLTRLEIQTIRLADGTEFQVATPAVVAVKAPVVTEPVATETVVEAVDNTEVLSAVAGTAENNQTATAESEDKE